MRVLAGRTRGAAGSAGGGERGHRRPWQSAGQITDGLFDAQTELVLSGPRAGGAGHGAGAAGVRGRVPGDAARGRSGRRSRGRAGSARRVGAPRGADDEVALAAARGHRPRRAVPRRVRRDGRGTDRGDARTARWLLLREYRTATRFTRPGASATLALDQFRRGKLSAQAARAAVAKDLLDAYQARLRELLEDIRRGIEQDLPVRRAEAAAQADGLLRDPRAALRARTAASAGGGARVRRSSPTLPESIDQADVGARGLHRRAVHARGGRAARAAAAAVPRARPGRVRPRREGRPGHARLRDPGGGRVPHRRGRGVRRPARPAGQARPDAHRGRGGRDRRARAAGRGGAEDQGGRADARAGRGGYGAAPTARCAARCRRRGRRRPTSPTTT